MEHFRFSHLEGSMNKEHKNVLSSPKEKIFKPLPFQIYAKYTNFIINLCVNLAGDFIIEKLTKA